MLSLDLDFLHLDAVYLNWVDCTTVQGLVLNLRHDDRTFVLVYCASGKYVSANIERLSVFPVLWMMQFPDTTYSCLDPSRVREFREPIAYQPF